MRRVAVGIALLTVGAIVACHVLLPERLAIKGPILNSLLGRGVDAPSDELIENRFQVAPGFEVQLFAEEIRNARFMGFSPGGDLIVSQPRLGQLVHVFGDRDGDGRSDGQKVLIGNLDRPHGFDFREGQLYIATSSQGRPGAAFDGDRETAWLTSIFDRNEDARLRIDLRRPRQVDEVRLQAARSGPLVGAPTRSTVLFSDGSSEEITFDRQGLGRIRFEPRTTDFIEVQIDAVEDDQ